MSATTAPAATAAPVSVPSAESAVALSISPGSGVIQIRNRSGKCLEVENSSTANGAQAQQWDCNGQAGSYWYLEYAFGNNFEVRIVNSRSGKCLDVSNSSTADGARVQQWSCANVGGQRWHVMNTSGATHVIRNVSSDKYLEIENSSTANGANAQIWRQLYQSGMYWH
ncbi:MULTISPECIES: RICIN domain-containing protein [unclassified Streptomyces]|uniref:RICIN domain-containing protein n=1 Tax=unclassified Streptomyces TaxID=2593676 RepID=UPI0013A6962B|nr:MULTISPECIES: RICIN domain-containing protein [unclassified Streptomyces]